jgi:endonuclease-3 related protein
MHDLLAQAYGPQHWWPAKTAFEVVLGAYLTQNTAWKAVERSLANLRAAGALTVEGLRSLDLGELQLQVQPSGFHSRKAPALKAFLAMLDEEFGGSLETLAASPTENLRRRLLALPGVGFETADAILLYALGHPVPVADEYLRRIVARHGLIEPAPGRNRKGYEALANLTRQAFASDAAESQARLFNEFHALTVALGKAHCRRTAHCAGCPLASDPHATEDLPHVASPCAKAIPKVTERSRNGQVVYSSTGPPATGLRRPKEVKTTSLTLEDSTVIQKMP